MKEAIEQEVAEEARMRIREKGVELLGEHGEELGSEP